MQKSRGSETGFDEISFVRMLNKKDSDAGKVLQHWVKVWCASGRTGRVDEPTMREMPPRTAQEILYSAIGGGAVRVGLDSEMKISILAVDGQGHHYGKGPKQAEDASLQGVFPFGGFLPDHSQKTQLLPSKAQREAANTMLAMAKTDVASRVSLCDTCGMFFLRTGFLRKAYHNGAFCPRHARLAGMKIKREGEHAAALERVLSAWKQWRSAMHPDRTFWIAKQAGTTRNFVTRNIDIQTGKVKENAKS